MTFDEYLEGEPEEEDEEGEFGDTFLSEDAASDDINVILIPKIDIDIEEVIFNMISILKKSKTTAEAFALLYEFYEQVRILTVFEVKSATVQTNAQELEYLKKMVRLR